MCDAGSKYYVCSGCRSVLNCEDSIRRTSASSAGACASSEPVGDAKATVARTAPGCATFRMDAGSTARRALGGTGVDAPHAGPTWSRRPASGPHSLCSLRPTSITTRPTTGRAICPASASAATCSTNTVRYLGVDVEDALTLTESAQILATRLLAAREKPACYASWLPFRRATPFFRSGRS